MFKLLKSRRGLLVLSLAVIMAIIVFQQLHWLTAVESALSASFRPVQGWLYQGTVKIKNVFVYFQSLKNLDQENDRLKNQIASLNVKNLALQKDLQDSAVLQSELNFVKSHKWQSTSAQIIGVSSDQSLQIIIINKGAKDNVKTGFPVIVNDGIIIGKIMQTTSTTAKILLLNDNHSKISAITQNSGKSPGLVTGQYGLSLKMELIPQDQAIMPGETVVTSGQEEYVPADLIIGTIEKITKKEGELFQEATVQPMANFNQLSIVTVIIPVAND